MRSRSLQPTTDEVAVARRFVRDAIVELGGTVTGRAGEDVALITSEAVANAVEHAGTAIELSVRSSDEGFVVSVHDDSSEAVQPPQLPSAADGHAHRGVGIIDALADQWGVDDIEGDGKTLWFIVTSADGPT